MKKKDKKLLLWGAVGLGVLWWLSKPKATAPTNKPAPSNQNAAIPDRRSTAAVALGSPYRDAVV